MSTPSRHPICWWLAEAAVVALFVACGLAHQCGRAKGLHPFPLLESDAANIASFVAAKDHPECFAGDEVLADEANFRVYSTVHLPALSGLARWTGDYGSAFECTLWLHVALQGIGFYLLGRVLFGSRLFSLLYAIMTLMPVVLKPIEFWGVLEDPIPRVTFQALLPFVLAGCLRWRDRPWAWLTGMLAMGAMVHVHPVSAPGCGLGLWCAAWACLSSAWSWKKRLGWMFLLGLSFLAAVTPFAIHYLANYAHGAPKTLSPSRLLEIMETRLAREFYDVPTALHSFFVSMTTIRWWHWLIGLLAASVTVVVRKQDRKSVSAIGLWVLGILFAAILLPWADQALARRAGEVPRQVDLVRGLRYLVPVLLLFYLWPLAEAWRLCRSRTVFLVALIALAGMAECWFWCRRHKPGEAIEGVRAWSHGQWHADDPHARALTEALDALDGMTSPVDPILPTHDALAVRYQALRPVVWCWKDGGILAYANHAALVRWHEVNVRYPEADGLRAGSDAAFSRLRDIASDCGAHYILTAYPVTDASTSRTGMRLVWSNSEYRLLAVQP